MDEMLKHLAPGGPAVLAVFILLVMFSRFMERQAKSQTEREELRDGFLRSIVERFTQREAERDMHVKTTVDQLTSEMRAMMVVVHEDRKTDREHIHEMYSAAMAALAQINRTVERRQKQAPHEERTEP